MLIKTRRRRAVAGVVLAGLAFASGRPSWGSNGEGLKNAKVGGSRKGAPGHSDFGGDIIDFGSVSPRDCAGYLCVSSPDKATYFIEAGCPGQFASYEPEESDEEAMETLVGVSAEGSSSGVSTGTLLSLACASGILAIGVGFVAGYKSSPSFAYVRIPSSRAQP